MNPQELKALKEKLVAAMDTNPVRMRALLARLQECLELSSAPTSAHLDVPLGAVNEVSGLSPPICG